MRQREANANSINRLMGLSQKHNQRVQSCFSSFAARCHAEYSPGPVKSQTRVTAKAEADYQGDLTKVRGLL